MEKVKNIENEGIDNVIIGSDLLGRVNLDEIAGLYASVFATPPWNEFVRCRQCGKFNGLEKLIGDSCDCGGELVEAYPIDGTVEYIHHDSDKPGFRLSLVNINANLAGFSWSYLTNIDDLVEDKWKLMEDKENIKSILSKYFSTEELFRYFSECGVNPNYRGFGLSNRLTESVTGPEDTVYRTNCLSPMMAVAQKIGFRQIMGPQVSIDRQSKRITQTGQILGKLDFENPNRTLFIKKN